MPRMKKDAVHVPATLAEATVMIAEFVELERKDALERLSAEAAIDRVKKQRDEVRAEIKAEMEPLFEGLKAWWEAGGKDEAARGKRSTEIANAKIGIRLGMPEVKFARKVKVKDVVDWLRGMRWARAGEFLRTTIALDKQAIIKAVRAEPHLSKRFEGKLSVEQDEEFFIDTGLDEEAIKREISAA